MATGILPGQRYSPESPPTPGETGFESKLVEYLKREYGRISDALIGASIFNFEPHFVAIPGAQIPKTNEGDVAYADGTSWNPGVGEGLYLRMNGAWVRLATQLTNRWEFIAQATPAAAASVDFTGLSAFRLLRATGYCLPATDAVNFYIRTDSNNGASFDAGAADYDYSTLIFGEGAVGNANRSAGDTKIITNGATIGNAVGEGTSFDFVFHQFNQATQMHMHGTQEVLRDNGFLYGSVVTGRRLSTTGRDALQFLFSAGNIASGYIILEGLRG